MCHRKNMLEFVFDSFSFKIADAYQFLLRTWFAAVAINRALSFARVPHDDCDITVIYVNSTENEKQVTRNSPCSFTKKASSFLLRLCDMICVKNASTFPLASHVLRRTGLSPSVDPTPNHTHTQTPRSTNKRSVTDNCNNIMCPIHWACYAYVDALAPSGATTSAVSALTAKAWH